MTEENSNFESNFESSEYNDLQQDNAGQNQNTAGINSENNDEDLKPDKIKGKNILKYILFLFLTFLAVFVIVYLIVDYNMHKLGLTPFELIFKQPEKVLNQDEYLINKNTFYPVKIEGKKDKYILTVDLKQFNNDAENIKFEASDNEIKIHGDIFISKNGKTESHSFYQNIISPEKFISEKIKKEQKGNKLIITIPVSKQ